jgi:hypothetical protein
MAHKRRMAHKVLWIVAALHGPKAAASALGASQDLLVWQRAVAGAAAYCAATLVTSPVDVVKCRMQLKQQQAAGKVTSEPLVVSMIREEGPQVLFAGIGPALLMAPAAMVQYTLMDPLRGVMPLFAAAIIAGSLDILIKCPFERLKTALQGGEKESFVTLLRHTWQASGVRGLWQGLGATLVRDLPYLVLKWLTYAQMQSLLVATIPNVNVANLLAGAVAGGVAATAVTPADVIKTRLQTTARKAKDATALTIGRELLVEDGAMALFRGLGPRLLRIPVYTAITLATFDFVKAFFAAANLRA